MTLVSGWHGFNGSRLRNGLGGRNPCYPIHGVPVMNAQDYHQLPGCLPLWPDAMSRNPAAFPSRQQRRAHARLSLKTAPGLLRRNLSTAVLGALGLVFFATPALATTY